MPRIDFLARAAVLALASAAAGLAAGDALGQQGDPDFVLVNNTRLTIRAMQASPVTDTQWGGDRLRGEAIQPGGRYQVRLSSPGVCQWDVRVIYENRQAEERRQINLCGMGELSFDGSAIGPIR